MMTENEVRDFIDEATLITGDRVSVTERIVQRWLADREDARESAARQVFDDLGVPR